MSTEGRLHLNDGTVLCFDPGCPEEHDGPEDGGGRPPAGDICECGHHVNSHGRLYATKYGAVHHDNCTKRGCSCRAPKVVAR